MAKKANESKRGKRSPLHCPVCGSVDIFPYVGFQCGLLWKCSSCMYVGPIALEKAPEKKGSGCVKKKGSGK